MRESKSEGMKEFLALHEVKNLDVLIGCVWKAPRERETQKQNHRFNQIARVMDSLKKALQLDIEIISQNETPQEPNWPRTESHKKYKL